MKVGEHYKGGLINMEQMYITGEIGFTDTYGIKEFRQDISNVDTLLIHSPGGCLFSAMAMFDALSEKMINTEIVGTTASAGTLIFMAGEKRRITKNSRFLIHETQSKIAGGTSEIEKRLDEHKELDKQIVGIYAEKTRLNEDQIIELMKENKYISATEALEKGFATEIINADETEYVNLNLKNMNVYTNQAENSELNALKSEIETLRNEKKDEMEALKAKLAEKDEEIKALKAKLAEKDDEEIENVVENYVKEGVISNDRKAEFLNKAKEIGVENFKFMLDAMPKPEKQMGEFRNQVIETRPGDEKETGETLKAKWKAGKLSTGEYMNKIETLTKNK